MQWIEGLFDAEGCVKIISGKERLTAKVCLDLTNTDLDLVLMAQRAMKLAMGIETGISAQGPTPNRKSAYHLRIYSKAGVARFFSRVQTPKLTERKRPLLEAWLSK